MKKALLFPIAAAAVMLGASAASAQTGDVIGHIYSTDIRAYINDTEVTFVVTADGQELNIHGLNHVITIETAGKINSIQVNGSEIHGTYDMIGNITRFVIK